MRSLLAALVPLLFAPAEAWRRVEPGLELVFPRDHGAHPEYRIEWWYLTGQVEDEEGRRFGVQFTIFRRGLDTPVGVTDTNPGVRQAFAGHLAVADPAAGTFRHAERAGFGDVASSADMELSLGGWTLAREEGDRLRLAAADRGEAIGMELTLVPAKRLVPQGAGGYSVKGPEPGNASAYVSWTRLAVEGTLTLDGRERRVRGEAWFDHEWGSSVLGAGVVGWDWFGLQLEDGRELKVFHLRRADGSPTAASAGTLVAADGTVRTLARDEFTIEPLAHWESPHNGAVYPAAWSVHVPALGLELEVRPLLPDCEIDSRTVDVVYWEGPVSVTGTATGRGYAELTGYADSLAGRF